MENKDRWLEVILYIAIVIILVQLCFNVYFISENYKITRENLQYCQIIENRYDINRDGIVDITDTLEITDYILEHKD